MKKLAITGSSGRIGRALHRQLSPEFDLVGLDISPSSTTHRITDIRNYDQVLKDLEGVEAIFHSAAFHARHVGLVSEKDFYEVNVEATETICRAALELGISEIIFTSTTALYGYANQGEGEAVWINEKTTPLPKTIYHQTKLEAEKVLKSYSCERLKVRVIRMSRCFPEPAEMMAVYRLHRGVDYRDVAEAHVLAWKQKKVQNFDLFVVSGSTPFLTEDVKALYSHPKEIIWKRAPELAAQLEKRGWGFPSSIDRVYDSSFAQKTLGWKPKRGFMDVFDQFDREDLEVLPPSRTK